MKIPIVIDKENEKDCSYGCPFRDEYRCTLFNQKLNISGYYNSIDIGACDMCSDMYRRHEREQNFDL